MKRIWPLILTVPMVLLLSAGSGHAGYCQTNFPPSNPDEMYIDHGDGTISDTRTGLMWMKCALGMSGENCEIGYTQTATWQGALQSSTNLGGYSDWRVPNVKELSSLVEDCRNQPAINTNLFPNAPGGSFWSSSPSARSTYSAWVVNFGSGWSDYSNRGGFNGIVRLVRGGH